MGNSNYNNNNNFNTTLSSNSSLNNNFNSNNSVRPYINNNSNNQQSNPLSPNNNPTTNSIIQKSPKRINEKLDKESNQRTPTNHANKQLANALLFPALNEVCKIIRKFNFNFLLINFKIK